MNNVERENQRILAQRSREILNKQDESVEKKDEKNDINSNPFSEMQNFSKKYSVIENVGAVNSASSSSSIGVVNSASSSHSMFGNRSSNVSNAQIEYEAMMHSKPKLSIGDATIQSVNNIAKTSSRNVQNVSYAAFNKAFNVSQKAFESDRGAIGREADLGRELAGLYISSEIDKIKNISNIASRSVVNLANNIKEGEKHLSDHVNKEKSSSRIESAFLFKKDFNGDINSLTSNELIKGCKNILNQNEARKKFAEFDVNKLSENTNKALNQVEKALKELGEKGKGTVEQAALLSIRDNLLKKKYSKKIRLSDIKPTKTLAATRGIFRSQILQRIYNVEGMESAKLFSQYYNYGRQILRAGLMGSKRILNIAKRASLRAVSLLSRIKYKDLIIKLDYAKDTLHYIRTGTHSYNVSKKIRKKSNIFSKSKRTVVSGWNKIKDIRNVKSRWGKKLKDAIKKPVGFLFRPFKKLLKPLNFMGKPIKIAGNILGHIFKLIVTLIRKIISAVTTIISVVFSGFLVIVIIMIILFLKEANSVSILSDEENRLKVHNNIQSAQNNITRMVYSPLVSNYNAVSDYESEEGSDGFSRESRDYALNPNPFTEEVLHQLFDISYAGDTADILSRVDQCDQYTVKYIFNENTSLYSGLKGFGSQTIYSNSPEIIFMLCTKDQEGLLANVGMVEESEMDAFFNWTQNLYYKSHTLDFEFDRELTSIYVDPEEYRDPDEYAREDIDLDSLGASEDEFFTLDCTHNYTNDEGNRVSSSHTLYWYRYNLDNTYIDMDTVGTCNVTVDGCDNLLLLDDGTVSLEQINNLKDNMSVSVRYLTGFRSQEGLLKTDSYNSIGNAHYDSENNTAATRVWDFLTNRQALGSWKNIQRTSNANSFYLDEFTAEQAASLMGNMAAESDFDPSAINTGYVATADRTSYNRAFNRFTTQIRNSDRRNRMSLDVMRERFNEANAYSYGFIQTQGTENNPAGSNLLLFQYGAYGLCQWTMDRKLDLFRFAVVNGRSINNLDVQMMYVRYEMKTKGYYNRLINAGWDMTGYNSINEMTATAMRVYEGAPEESLGTRQAVAKAIYDDLAPNAGLRMDDKGVVEACLAEADLEYENICNGGAAISPTSSILNVLNAVDPDIDATDRDIISKMLAGPVTHHLSHDDETCSEDREDERIVLHPASMSWDSFDETSFLEETFTNEEGIETTQMIVNPEVEEQLAGSIFVWNGKFMCIYAGKYVFFNSYNGASSEDSNGNCFCKFYTDDVIRILGIPDYYLYFN